MYLPYQIDWRGRGYFTPSLYGEPLPELQEIRDEWPVLQAHFARVRQADFSALNELILRAREARSGEMRQYFLYLLSDAGPISTLRALADDALDSSHPQYPADVAIALIDSGVLAFVPDILELYARRVDNALSLPIELSRRLEPKYGLVAEKLPEDDDAEIYTAAVGGYHADLQIRIGRADVPVLKGEVLGVRRLAELYLEALKEREGMWNWYMYRRFFEASTGIDMSDCYEARNTKPLTTAAKLETFLSSPEAQLYEHGVRYFWGHRIPD
jgi:hypothetical protein